MALSAKNLLAKGGLSAASLTDGGGSWGTAPMTEEQRRDKASAIARRTLVGSGNEDPTEDKPGGFRKLIGTMAAPGVGIQSLIYNATNLESTEDVNPLEEMWKSAKGEQTITGSDTVREWGIENKWGQALGGFALDMLTDPLTYLTAGYSTTVKAAAGVKSIDFAMDMKHLSKLVDDGESVANQLLKMSHTYGDDVAEIASRYAGKSVKDLSRADANGVATALRQRLSKEMGDKTGIRFMGQMIPGTSTAPDALTNMMKGLGEVFPGSQAWQKAFVSGNLDEIWTGASKALDTKAAEKYGLELDAVLGGRRIPLSSGKIGPNQLVRMGKRAADRKYTTATRSADMKGKYLRDLLVDALPNDDARHAMTFGIGRQFGDLSNQKVVHESYQKIGYLEELIDAGDTAMIPRLKAEQRKHFALMKELTFDDGKILETVKTALAGNYTDEIGEQVLRANEVMRGALDDASQRLFDLGEITGAEGSSVMGKGAYLPGMVGEAPTDSLRTIMSNIGMDVSDNLRMPRGVDEVPTTFNSAFQKTYLNPEDRLTQGLLTNTDIADIAPVKLMKDEMRIAKAEYKNEMAALFGREVKDPVLADSIAKLSEPFTSDVAFKGALETYDRILNEWKSAATTLNIPRFGNRNFISNKYLMMVRGQLDLASERESIAFLARVRNVMQKGGSIATLDPADQKRFMEYVDMGVFTSRGDLMDIVGTENLKKYAIGSEVEKSGNLPKRFYDAWKKLGGDYNELIENQGRLSVYLFQQSKGVDGRVAAQVVDDTLYSYDARLLTAFENNVMKRIVPFYTWMRRNTPNMAQALATNPKMMSIPRHLQQNTADTVGYDPDKAPPYLRDAGLIFGMGDDPENLTAFRTEGLMPINEAGMMFDTALSLDPTIALENIAADANPLLRVPLELLMNKSLFSDAEIKGGVMGESRKVSKGFQLIDDIGRNIPGWTDLIYSLGGRWEETDDGRTVLTLAGDVEYILRNLFPPLESAGGMNPENEDAIQQTIGFLTGVRPVNIDIPALEQRKKTNDYFDLQEAMSDKRRTDRKRIDIPTLFGGGK